MTEIEKLKEQIKKQEKYIEVIKTEQLYPALELLKEYKINLAKAECPFEVGDTINYHSKNFGKSVLGVLQEPKIPCNTVTWYYKKIGQVNEEHSYMLPLHGCNSPNWERFSKKVSK